MNWYNLPLQELIIFWKHRDPLRAALTRLNTRHQWALLYLLKLFLEMLNPQMTLLNLLVPPQVQLHMKRFLELNFLSLSLNSLMGMFIMHYVCMPRWLQRSWELNVLAFKDRHNALNGNLTCYSNCWTAKPAISHSFVLNHRLKRCVVRWDSRGLVYLAAPEDSVLLSTLLTMPDIHPNPGPQYGQQENRLVGGVKREWSFSLGGVDLTTVHRDSSNGSNGGADTILFWSRNDLLSLRRFALKPQAPVLNTPPSVP